MPLSTVMFLLLSLRKSYSSSPCRKVGKKKKKKTNVLGKQKKLKKRKSYYVPFPLWGSCLPFSFSQKKRTFCLGKKLRQERKKSLGRIKEESLGKLVPG